MNSPVRVRLHLGALQSQVQVTSHGTPDVRLTLAMGWQQLVAQVLRHAPPTPLEMEHAIEWVEDEVVRVIGLVPPGQTVESADAVVRRIAAASENRGHTELTLAAVEHTFNRLADRAAGRPVAADDLPGDGEFAAALLMLREFMHHGQVSAVRLV